MNMLDAIEARKSTRGYLKRQIEEETLRKILDSGNKAPNAGPFHMSVIQDPELIQRMEKAARARVIKDKNEFLMQRLAIPGYEFTYGAPVLVILSAPDGKNSVANCACAAANMCIAAAEFHLGSCYLGGILNAFNEDAGLLHAARVPEGYMPRCGFVVGFSAEKQIPGNPRALKDNITFVN